MAFWLAEIAGKQSAPYRGGEGRLFLEGDLETIIREINQAIAA